MAFGIVPIADSQPRTDRADVHFRFGKEAADIRGAGINFRFGCLLRSVGHSTFQTARSKPDIGIDRPTVSNVAMISSMRHDFGEDKQMGATELFGLQGFKQRRAAGAQTSCEIKNFCRRFACNDRFDHGACGLTVNVGDQNTHRPPASDKILCSRLFSLASMPPSF